MHYEAEVRIQGLSDFSARTAVLAVPDVPGGSWVGSTRGTLSRAHGSLYVRATMTADPSLTPEQRQQLDEARLRAKKVLGAARVATFNGWSIGSLAAITTVFGLTSPPALLLGLGMAWVARNEFKGRDLLRCFDVAGPRFLGRNQVGFMLLIIAYCVWSMTGAITSPDPSLQEIQDLLGIDDGLIRSVTLLVYGAVIAATILFQGLNARYYFRRRQKVEEYLAATPEWVLDLQRSAALG